MVSIKTLKQSSNNVERLASEMDKLKNATGAAKDDRFWQPTVDKAGNGSATIRFLPGPAADIDPENPSIMPPNLVKIYDHGFSGPSGKWYIEMSLTSLGQEDPATKYNSYLYNKIDSDESPARKQARKQARRLGYISNIYVVADSGCPENNGKQFLFRFGKKLFQRIEMAWKPDPAFPDEVPFDPFDLENGANFQISVYNNEQNYRQYDKCKYANKQSALSKDEAVLEKIWNAEYSLKEFLAPDKFKSYEELEKKLAEVLLLPIEELRNPGTTGGPDKKSGYEHHVAESAKGGKSTLDKLKEDIDDDIPFDGKSETGSDDEDMKFFKSLLD